LSRKSPASRLGLGIHINQYEGGARHRAISPSFTTGALVDLPATPLIRLVFMTALVAIIS
jgi:hypothetical protein